MSTSTSHSGGLSEALGQLHLPGCPFEAEYERESVASTSNAASLADLTKTFLLEESGSGCVRVHLGGCTGLLPFQSEVEELACSAEVQFRHGKCGLGCGRHGEVRRLGFGERENGGRMSDIQDGLLELVQRRGVPSRECARDR